MKINQKIVATFTPEERATVHEVLNMFTNYDDDDWELLTECFEDELGVSMGNWFEDLEKIYDYMSEHS